MIFRLLVSLQKEWRLLRRDWHALLVLFVMPSLFVLIMSLALQGQFAENAGPILPGSIEIRSESPEAQDFYQTLKDSALLALTDTGQPVNGSDALFHITLLDDFDQQLYSDIGDQPGVEIRFAATLPLRDQSLIMAAIRQVFARYHTRLIAADMGLDPDRSSEQWMKDYFIVAVTDEGRPRPTSVQQSVPAWLIFAMFFIAIPISTTILQERQQGTFMRLHTLGVSNTLVQVARLLPYFLINQIQLLVMLAIGRWLLPQLGGSALSLEISWPALLFISCSTSIAALGFASLIAAFARSIEQATVISGAMNILFAALGGIMIPRFVMPATMQELAAISPMSWALDGFLEVLVNAGQAADILLPCLVLTGIGVLTGTLSIALNRRRT
jgi:ABC-2 type transport system permease protein